MNRYVVAGSEGEYQPGSNGQVLRNLLDIADVTDINIAEEELLAALYLRVFDDFPDTLTFETICHWHRA